MRILIAHNAYQHRGGEDMVVESEITLLRAHGHEVAEYRRHNDEITGMSRVALFGQTVWSSRTEVDIEKYVADFRPEVIHVHNTLPLISPSLYYAAGKARVPVIQTLHNFRMLCPQAMFLRDGKVCEDCLGNLPWRGVVRGCYRDSKAQSAVIAGMLVTHRVLGTYRNKITRYIALNEFCRKKFIEGGLSSEQISVKPNFADIPVSDDVTRHGGLFVGRLSAEKGISILAGAMRQLPKCDLKIIGSGSEEAVFNLLGNTQKLGFLPRDKIFSHMRSSAYLLMPSICYENFPLTLVEAFACGLPVIASRLGSMAELIEDGKTGLLFDSGSAEDLAKKIAWAEANSLAIGEMGRNARREYEEKYTPSKNHDQLMQIYIQAIETCRSREN
jgi:glycosyltransferase involved in cell wall biosynthesis